MHEAYPGGIEAYVQNARRLLAASAAGANPLEGWTPSVPLEGLGVQLTPGDAEFERYEKLGLEAAVHLAFAVPAGGLGERLGYSGVKFSLPAEISSGASVLQVRSGSGSGSAQGQGLGEGQGQGSRARLGAARWAEHRP